MSSLKLDRDLELKSKEDLQKDLDDQKKLQKIFRVLTVITGVLFLIALVILLFTPFYHALLGIIPFLLFLTSFMLFAYTRQNIAALEELLRD